jgi:hypothetical protein
VQLLAVGGLEVKVKYCGGAGQGRCRQADSWRTRAGGGCYGVEDCVGAR